MTKRNRRNKEEIAEDWCFSCKDGGSLRVCDYRNCLKSYHPCCVEKEDSFLENGKHWTCASHSCFVCRKASKFKCFCCPNAFCGNCAPDAEFATVKGARGFCSHCAKLGSLIEDNIDVDSDGGKIDFKDRDTYECLFAEYYEIIKEKEGLNSQHVRSAWNKMKSGRNKHDLDEDGGGDSGESEDGSNFVVSDYEDLNDTAAVKKKRCSKKIKSIKTKVKDKKKEFIGWGSRSLIEFLKHIGRDTSIELSEHDVVSIILGYCKENNLFDPQKKRKILCDTQLKSLIRRKSVNRNNIHNLLAPHFASNFDEVDGISSSSEDRDDNKAFEISRPRKSILSTKSFDKVVSEESQSCFAAIVTTNLKLVYLRRSLVEQLLKQQETFEIKVLGSFVRIKADPNDYSQKNSHLLVQVTGITRSSKNAELYKEILLQLSNVPKDVPICKISDDDFSEAECQDLYYRMRNGLLKQPTILELEQKARSLHEDIIKHWIPRELALLQNRIDQANERGKRRELFEYMDRKLKLETPSEQSRLLSEIPKVIPDVIDTNLSPEGSPTKDKLEQNGLLESAIGDTCNTVGRSEHIGFATCLKNRTDFSGLSPKTPAKGNQYSTAFPASGQQPFVNPASQEDDAPQINLLQPASEVRQHDPQGATLSKELNPDSQNINLATYSRRRPRNTDSGSGIDSENLSATGNVEKTIAVQQSISVADPIKGSACDKHDTSVPAVPAGKKEFSISAAVADPIKVTVCDKQDASVPAGKKEFSILAAVADPIKVSECDKQDTSVPAVPSGKKEFNISAANIIELSDDDDDVESAIWHCMSPYGERKGPFSMSVLKIWSEASTLASTFKVLKTGQSETQAIPLADALGRIFPTK